MKFEILDEYIYLQEAANDHQVRAVIELSGRIDVSLLRDSIEKSYEWVPLLSSRLLFRGKELKWDKINPATSVHIFKPDIEGPAESVLEDFLAVKIYPFEGPQVKTAVIQSVYNDILVIVVNHMVFDGRGFLEYLNLLAMLYNGIIPPAGTYRSERDVFKVIGSAPQLKMPASFLFRRRSAVPAGRQSPLTGKPVLYRRRFGETAYSGIIRRCKLQGVSVNDYMIALLAAAVRRSGLMPGRRYMDLDVMIDARRYDTGGILSPFCNASTMESVRIPVDSGDPLRLLPQVHAGMEKIKNNLPGYRNLQLLRVLRYAMPGFLYRRVLSGMIKKPVFSITNLGLIEATAGFLVSTGVAGIYFVAAAKYNNSIQFSISGFKNSLTVTTFGCYTPEAADHLGDIYRNMNMF